MIVSHEIDFERMDDVKDCSVPHFVRFFALYSYFYSLFFLLSCLFSCGCPFVHSKVSFVFLQCTTYHTHIYISVNSFVVLL